MCPTAAQRVNELLLNWGHGVRRAFEELISLVYGELRRIARRYVWPQQLNHALQNVAIVHEPSLRLLHKAHFGGVATHVWLPREITQKEVRR